MSNTLFKKPLYRIPDKGKVFGVCAGIAEAGEWDTWLVRAIVLVSAFLTGFTLVGMGYLIAFFVLDPKPSAARRMKESGCRFSDRVKEAKETISNIKSKPKQNKSASQIKEQLLTVKKRVEGIEAFVTSKQYILEKEFQQMKKGQ
jgi:phage shock protein C